MLQENAASEEKVIVAVKQGNLLATAFHPELTADTRWSVSCASEVQGLLKFVPELCPLSYTGIVIS